MNNKDLLFRNIYRSIRDAHIPNEYWYADIDSNNEFINIFVKQTKDPSANQEHWVLEKKYLINKDLGENNNALLSRPKNDFSSCAKNCWRKCRKNIKRLFHIK